MKILAIEGSTRSKSSTLMHLRTLLESQGSDVSFTIIRLLEVSLPAFSDDRASGQWLESQALEKLLAQMLDCDMLILASPLYWYTVSAPMKNFIDHWSYFMRHPRAKEHDFLKGKWIFPLIIASEGATAEETDPVFKMLQLSAAYVDARFLPGFLGEGDRAGDPADASLDRIRAIRLGELIAAASVCSPKP